MPIAYCSCAIDQGLLLCKRSCNTSEQTSWKYMRIPSWEDRYETWLGIMEDYHRPLQPTTRWQIIDREFSYWLNSKNIQSFVELYNQSRSMDEKNELKLIFQTIASYWDESSHVAGYANGKKIWKESLLPQDCWKIAPKTMNETCQKVRGSIQELIRQRRHLEAADALRAWKSILPEIYELYQELEESYQMEMIKHIFHFHDREQQYERTFCRYKCVTVMDLMEKMPAVSDGFLYYLAPRIKEKDTIDRYCTSALNHLDVSHSLSAEREKALQYLKSKKPDLFDDSHIKFKQKIIADINHFIDLSESGWTWDIDQATLLLYQVAWTLDNTDLKKIKERYINALKKLRIRVVIESDITEDPRNEWILTSPPRFTSIP